MKKLALFAAAITGAAMLSPAVMAQDAPTGDYVCLITFGSAEQAQAGADADALSAVYVSREEAEQLAAQSGGVQAFWDYSNTYPTNAAEQEFCLDTFNPDDGDGQANPNSAKNLAPGQVKGEGESAKDYAPGQMKGDGETGKDHAPGQLKKGTDNGSTDGDNDND